MEESVIIIVEGKKLMIQFDQIVEAFTVLVRNLQQQIVFENTYFNTNFVAQAVDLRSGSYKVEISSIAMKQNKLIHI